MSKRTVNITTLPLSPEQDRRKRTITYLVMMAIRLVCLILCVVLQGWWILIFALGAVFLPYFAVVIANASDGRSKLVEGPGDLPLPQIESKSAAQGEAESDK
ncbi:MAG: DUF3099 domain-containing protein [Cryobacterium sp.]|nr:DUF3099 domain-containing protein [Cryobacterium sp.]MBX3103910.1 DUF3099 domain-containing protein [Cryobacterium sp.]